MALGTATRSAPASWAKLCILPMCFHNISGSIDEPMYVLPTSFPTAEAFSFKSVYQILTMIFGFGVLHQDQLSE